jgi:two-component system NtrC family sensor kinase
MTGMVGNFPDRIRKYSGWAPNLTFLLQETRAVAAGTWVAGKTGMAMSIPQSPSGVGSTVTTWAGMLAAVAMVAVIAYWDAAREASAALADFAAAQVALANGLATPVTTRLPELSSPATAPAALASLRRVEVPGRVLLLLGSEGRDGLLRTDGSVARASVIESAIARREPWVRLSREEAAALGLPPRTAIGGIAELGDGWSVVVVATAQEERDRERRAQWRLVLGVALAAGLVLAFGGLALRRQRKELELARELAVAEVQHARDERLVRADKLATMGALATGIAHEVSTPLGVMMGRAEQLLPKVSGDERARRSVEAILEQGERIGRVVRGFLALARGERPSFDDVPPAEIARTSVELVEHRFDKAGVQLHKEIPDGLPLIACEPLLVEQALANLLLNACDACRPGGLVTLLVEPEADRVAFVVTDDGEGISPESAARVIEPFFTTKLPGSGTGLGLAIASEIIKHHSGTLTIEPRGAAPGTRARIELPALQRNHEQAALLH